MKTTQEKYNDLKEYLRSLGSVAVAFSSGVDSTFLLRVAHDVLGDRAIAVTAVSCSFPERERKEAQKFCEENHIRQVLCQSEELDIDGFRSNPKNRCYLCKHELFEKILKIAEENGIAAVAEGSNMDDNGDYRPGLMAVKELGIKSPLRHVELTKAEIRELSKELAFRPGTSSPLPVWLPVSFTEKRSMRKSLAWSIGQNSCCLILDFIRCVCASTERWRGSSCCRQNSVNSWRNPAGQRYTII